MSNQFMQMPEDTDFNQFHQAATEPPDCHDKLSSEAWSLLNEEEVPVIAGTSPGPLESVKATVDPVTDMTAERRAQLVKEAMDKAAKSGKQEDKDAVAGALIRYFSTLDSFRPGSEPARLLTQTLDRRSSDLVALAAAEIYLRNDSRNEFRHLAGAALARIAFGSDDAQLAREARVHFDRLRTQCLTRIAEGHANQAYYRRLLLVLEIGELNATNEKTLRELSSRLKR